MAVVISLDAWRSQRRDAGTSTGCAGRRPPSDGERGSTTLGTPATAPACSAPSSGSTSSSGRDADRDRLAPDVERDMLTIVGELAMGWLDQAADRAERLCDRLVAQGG